MFLNCGSAEPTIEQPSGGERNDDWPFMIINRRPRSSRLTASQTISVERNGQQSHYRAEIDRQTTPAINRAMATKYGWADRYIGVIFGGRDDSVAIKLIPQP
ncbi:MAG: hypothetical protein ACR2PZ_24165 [Pseudomonadales bacterium]